MTRIANSWLWHACVGTILAIAGWAVYRQAFDAPFVFDDIPNIELNRAIQISKLDAHSLWIAATRSPLASRPLAYLTFAINYRFGELDVWGYHVANLCLHVATALVVYWLSHRLFQQAERLCPTVGIDGDESRDDWPLRFGALISAMLFLLHPIQTQSVTYLVQRMNVLASLFYLLSLTCYVEGRLPVPRSRRLCWWCLSALAWFLALLSKQNAITLPIAVLMYEWYFVRNLRVALSRRVLLWVVGAGSLLLLAGLFYALLVPNLFSTYVTRDFTMAERLMTQPRVLAVYAGLIIWPLSSRFNLLHHVETSTSLLSPPSTLLAIFALIAYMAIAIAVAKRARMVSFAMLWVLVHLALESTVIPLEMIYEHRMYLPMFGLCAWAGWLTVPLWRSPFRVGIAGISLVMLATLGWQTYARNEVWRNPLDLWNDVIQKNKHSARAYINRAGLYSELGRWPLAQLDYDRAIELAPDYIMSHYGRGLVRLNLGDAEGAIVDLTNAIQSVGMNDVKASAFRNRGAAYSLLGNKSQAIDDYVVALRLDPNSAVTAYNLANVLREQGRFVEAIDRYKQCIQLDPVNGRAHVNLAVLMATCPDVSLRDPSAALVHAQEALKRLGEKNHGALEAMARASWVNGLREEAIEWQKRAIDAAPYDRRGVMRRTLDYYLKEGSSQGTRP